MSRRLLILVAVTLVLTTALWAQEAVYLKPRSPVVTGSTATLALSNSLGPVGNSPVWNSMPVRWAFVKTGQTQLNFDDVKNMAGSAQSAEFPIPAPGPVMVGVDFLPVIEQVLSARLNNLSEPSNTGQHVTIRHYRSAITLFEAQWLGAGAVNAGIATAKTSLTASIHPLMDPFTFQIGGDMALELIVRGQETEGATISVSNTRTGRNWTVKSGPGGIASFTPDAPGEYECRFQKLEPTADDPKVSFECFTTTLTFTLKGQEARS